VCRCPLSAADGDDGGGGGGGGGEVRRLRDDVHAHADVDDVAADPGPVHGRRPTPHTQVPLHRHRVRAAVVTGRRRRQRHVGAREHCKLQIAGSTPRH